MRVLFAPAMYADSTPTSWNLSTVNSIAKYTQAYFNEASYGKVWMDYTVVSDYQTQLMFRIACTKDTATLGTIKNQTDAEIAKLYGSTYVNTFDRRVYLTGPVTSMGSKGTNAGKDSWVYNCMGADYAYHSAPHELGHSFGLGHGGNINFGASALVGTVVTIPSLDKTIGGSIQTVYNGASMMDYDGYNVHFHAAEKTQLGWIVPKVYSRPSASYTLTAMAVAGGNCYGIRVPCSTYKSTSNRTYWIEYRRKIGTYEKYAPEGVVVRIEGDLGCYVPLRVFWGGNGTLTQGMSLTDGSVKIEVVSMTATEAVVQVSDLGTVTPPATNPNIATLASLQPLVAGLTPDTITQAQKDSVNTLNAALVVKM